MLTNSNTQKSLLDSIKQTDGESISSYPLNKHNQRSGEIKYLAHNTSKGSGLVRHTQQGSLVSHSSGFLPQESSRIRQARYFDNKNSQISVR